MQLDIDPIRDSTSALLGALCAHHPQGERILQAVREERAELVVSYSVTRGVIVIAAVQPDTLNDAQAVATIDARTGECAFTRFGGEPEPVH